MILINLFYLSLKDAKPVDWNFRHESAVCHFKQLIYVLNIGWTVQGSTFRGETTQTARIKGIVSSSGYISVSLNGVWRVYFEVGCGNAEVGLRPIEALDASAPEGSGNRKTEFGGERFRRISDNCRQYPSVATLELWTLNLEPLSYTGEICIFHAEATWPVGITPAELF